MARTLSKSRFQKGLQCEKALWLSIHRRDLAAPTSESQQWIFDQGHQVGALAQQLFAGGVEVTEDHLHQAEALETTARLLDEGVKVLYEPAFTFGGTFTRADILVATDDGRWDLYEVKSGTSLKDVYVTDATVQTYTIEGAGLPIRTANVVHLDTSYVYPGGAYDPHALFAVKDVTDAVRAYLPTVPATVVRFQRVLEGPEPEVRIGACCAKPYDCEFVSYCHACLPGPHPITGLPRLGDAELHALLDAGCTDIAGVPEDFPGLTAAQREAARVVREGEPYVDADGLARDLARLEWPVRHLDFETINPALPLWPGTRPYQVIPFQYSIHIHELDGSVEHREFLHAGTDDPRPALARQMLADLGEQGSIAHYTAYERTQLENLATALPELAPALAAVRTRLFDLEPVIRRNTRHPESAGRSSIKHVLPAWCPDLSYAGLAIADGQTASVRYLRVASGVADPDEAASTLSALLEYCGLDTYAMVRLLDEMRRLAAG